LVFYHVLQFFYTFTSFVAKTTTVPHIFYLSGNQELSSEIYCTIHCFVIQCSNWRENGSLQIYDIQQSITLLNCIIT